MTYGTGTGAPVIPLCSSLVAFFSQLYIPQSVMRYCQAKDFFLFLVRYVGKQWGISCVPVVAWPHFRRAKCAHSHCGVARPEGTALLPSKGSYSTSLSSCLKEAHISRLYSFLLRIHCHPLPSYEEPYSRTSVLYYTRDPVLFLHLLLQ